MAQYTPNYNMIKPTIDDDALIADINGNMDIIDTEMKATRDNIAIVVNGNTAPRAITAGQYLFIKGHSSLSAGGYHATANIANGGAVTSSNVTADPNGIVNGALDALNGKIADHAPKGRKRIQNNEQAVFTFESYVTSAIIFSASNNANGALYVFSNGYLAPIKTATDISFALSSDYKTITVTNNTGTPIDVGCVTTQYIPTVS